MIKKLISNVLMLLGVLCLVSVACETKKPDITIATAANMRYAMVELTQAFENETDLKTELIIGSSGKLLSQIVSGAPYDIFFSADEKYPNALATDEKTPEIYAYGKLVLWSTLPDHEVTLGNLLDEERIALANPKTAPYGKATEEVLDQFGVKRFLRKRLVYGESISQVNQFITTQNASVGFTSKSSVIANEEFGGQWEEISDTLYTPIAQSMIVLKNSKQQELASQFAEFVKSEKGQEILNRFGYSTELF